MTRDTQAVTRPILSYMIQMREVSTIVSSGKAPDICYARQTVWRVVSKRTRHIAPHSRFSVMVGFVDIVDPDHHISKRTRFAL